MIYDGYAENYAIEKLNYRILANYEKTNDNNNSDVVGNSGSIVCAKYHSLFYVGDEWKKQCCCCSIQGRC